MSCECKIIVVKYFFIKYGWMKLIKKIKIKNKLVIFYLYYNIKLFYRTC